MHIRFIAFFSILLLATGARAAEDYCFDCHGVQEGTSLPFKNDVHYKNTLSCDDCHGGDPKINNMNTSKLPQTGFRPRATRQAIPDYCGRCHSDAKYMAKYNPKLSVASLALYARGVHGRALAAGKKKSAQCVDCHGVHDILAVSDPASTVSPKNVSDTCAKCHEADAAAFRASPHGRRFIDDKRPGCVTCHASHDTQSATTALISGKSSSCVRCHNPDSGPAKAGDQIAQLLTSLESAGPTSKEALDRARVAAHTVSLKAVQRAAASPATQPATAPQ